LVGRVGDAVKVRGMFIHPNQLRFAIAQVPGVSNFQAVITRHENRDKFTLRVLADESSDQERITGGLSAAINAACRVNVDDFEFVSADQINAGEEIILDKRVWE
jgi:phenylacetate-CoA ligase